MERYIAMKISQLCKMIEDSIHEPTSYTVSYIYSYDLKAAVTSPLITEGATLGQGEGHIV